MKIRLFLTVFCLLCGLHLFARSWAEIRQSGKLQILTVESELSEKRGLQRVIMPIDRERALLRSFCRSNGLHAEYLTVPSFGDLFRALQEGQGDLISSNVAVTSFRQQHFLLSEPFAYTNEVVFTGEVKSSVKGNQLNSLSGYTGWVLPDTTYGSSFRHYAGDKKNIVLKDLRSTISHDTLIEMVANGKLSYSVLDECDLDAWLAYRTGIRKLFPVRSGVPLVFAARKDSAELIEKLNAFILRVRPAIQDKKTESEKGRYLTVADLDMIRQRGYIRMLTTNTSFCCYLQQGQLLGFEYELAKKFADELDVVLIPVIVRNFKDLTTFLENGDGDFIAANFTRTPERMAAFQKLSFGPAYCSVTQMLAGRPNEKISDPSQLAGRKLHIRKSNSYYATLLNLQKQGIALEIKNIGDDERPIQTLSKVASGEYDLTVIDNTYLTLAIELGCKVKPLLALSEEQPFSWLTRKNNPQLTAAVQAFFKKENKSAFFNIRKKYYYGTSRVKKLVPMLADYKGMKISPYDSLFQKYGKKYNFDWMFLAAQSFQESRFDPTRVNHIGAAGLMQVMPKTAKELGISNLTNPDCGIRAGTTYMDKLRGRFSGDIKDEDLLCFCLASYNAGYGHVSDARILAAKLGLNPNVWFGHTEKALSLLADPKYYTHAKYGYCRASETIAYVQNITLYAYQYRKLLAVAPKDLKK